MMVSAPAYRFRASCSGVGAQPLPHNPRKHDKIRPPPDRENAFAGASGGGSVTNTELSPVSMASARDRRRNLRINDRQTLGL